MIYPQNPTHSWTVERNLGTKTEDKRYTYQEFMARISRRDMRPDDIPWDIRSPRDVGILNALEDLRIHRIGGGTVKVTEISPSLTGWSPPQSDKTREIFSELFERAMKKFHMYSKSEVLVNVVGNERRNLVSKLSGEIYNLRKEETWDYIARRFEIMDIRVVAPTTPSAVTGGLAYRKVDVAATIASYTDSNNKWTGALAERFPTQDEFKKFVSILFVL